MIEKRLMFYTVTTEQESKAIYALEFKEQLCGSQGVLLLGKLLDEYGNELEATDQTFLRLSRNQEKFTLSYQDEIPWGICKLLQQFQGTDYQHFLGVQVPQRKEARADEANNYEDKCIRDD